MSTASSREPRVGLARRDGCAGPVAVAGAGPVVLVRYRVGVVGETSRTVHVVALPTVVRTGVVRALCGAVLISGDLEAVALGEGMPCIACVLHCVTSAEELSSSPDHADPPGTGPTGPIYQEWGWPVTLHQDEVRLSLGHTVSAVMIPARLGVGVIPVLTQRRCAPAVLSHPYLPDRHIVLTGEKYGLPLPWPDQAHQVTGVLLLPPTSTPRGPITWITGPHPDSLQLCREIDLFTALRSTTDGHTPLESDPS
jgi:hypothetical protein